jgi:hypothetical protein
MSLKESTVAAEILPVAARTADANSSGVDTWNKGRPREAIILLDIGAVSGTTPTLDLKIQESSDNSTWNDLTGGAFPQKTAAGFSELAIRGFRRYIRAVHDVGGTSPSFTATVLAVFGNGLDEPV